MTTNHSDDLRAALSRADKANSAPMNRSRSVQHRQEYLPVEHMSALIVERLAIRRVDIKVEVAAFIDHHFETRTDLDGTVLKLSREKLVEELTVLFYGLEERASQIEDQFPETNGKTSSTPRQSLKGDPGSSEHAE